MAARTCSLDELRQALHVFYCENDPQRRAAGDAALRSFVKETAAWQLSLELLTVSSLQPHELSFAASVLRNAARKSKELLDAALSLLRHLVRCIFAYAAQPAVNQLATAASTLAVRSMELPAGQLVPHMLSLAHAAVEGSFAGQAQHCALLKLLAALPEACASLDVSMHPQRRLAAQAALRVAPEVAPIVQQALCQQADSSSSSCHEAGLQLLQAWCATGMPPAGLPTMPRVLDQLHSLLWQPGLGSAATEALAALYSTCEQPGSSEQWELLDQLLGRLRPTVHALAARQPEPAAHQQHQLLFSALDVLHAAGRVLDSTAAAKQPQQLRADAALASDFVCNTLLQLLQHSSGEVATASLQLWDERLERWKAGSGPSPAQQQQLAKLVPALLQRMTLPASVGAAATADARDLPEATSHVRRELADTFRSAADVLGPEAVTLQLVSLAEQAAGSGLSSPWVMEVLLYGLNLASGRQKQRPQLATVQRVVALVLGALALDTPPKLAGTALTLAGGMPGQLLLLEEASGAEGPATAVDGSTALHQQQLQLVGHDVVHQLLSRLLLLLEAPAEPLRRNAATCCWRLCSHPALAAVLAAKHGEWGGHLCAAYTACGGMQQKCSRGEDRDLSTAEFLLRAMCYLCAADASGGSRQLVQQLLRQPLAAMEQACAAAAATAPSSQQQQQQQQQHVARCAVQLEALATMLELLARPSSKAAAQLPGLLEGSWPMLCSIAEAALQHGGGLLAAVCRLAVSIAQVSSSAALQLARPLCAQPREPCILGVLTAVAEQSRHTSQQALHELDGSALAAAVRSSLQAVAAQHADDPEWQVPALRLGLAAVRHLPAAAGEPATLDALLQVLAPGLQSWHRDVCEAALACAAELCCSGCPEDEPASGDSLRTATDASLLHLQQHLNGGVGPALLLALLLAAAGTMPAYMMSPIAEALHGIWRALGSSRFAAWLRPAVLELSPGDAPWRSWKQDTLQAALAELLSDQSLADSTAFKRRLKVLCGGKKKGQPVAPPARKQ